MSLRAQILHGASVNDSNFIMKSTALHHPPDNGGIHSRRNAMTTGRRADVPRLDTTGNSCEHARFSMTCRLIDSLAGSEVIFGSPG